MIPKHYSLVQEHPRSYEIHDQRDGKRFHIAKHGLNLQMHGELAKIPRLADGGPVGPTLGSIIGYPGAPKTAPVPPPKPKPQNLAEGTPDVEPVQGVSEGSPLVSVGKPAPAAEEPASAGVASSYDSTGGVTAPTNAASSASAESEEEKEPTQTMPSASAEIPAGAKPVQQGAGDVFMNPNSALESERDAIMKGAKAEGDAATKTAQAYKDYSETIDNMDSPEEIMANHKELDDKLFKSFMDKSIDPDHYWNTKSTGQKILAGIGMALGGAGAAASGQPNLAVETIHQAINRDIESQKNDQSKALNLWKMNREATQSDVQANLLAKNQLLNAAKAKAMQYAAEAGGAEAQARAAQVVMPLEREIQMNRFRYGMYAASQQPGPIQADPSMMLNMIPDHQKAEVAKEITTGQKMRSLYDSVERNANDLKSKTMNGLFSPRDRESAIDSFASQMDVLSDHRFNLEASKLKGDAFFPKPGDSKQTVENKDRRRREFFQDQLQAPVFKSATGIDLNRFASTGIQSPPSQQEIQTLYARQHANSPDPKVRQRVNFIKQKYGL